MKTYKVTCVRCKQKYDSEIPDDYYCKECEKEREKLVKEIDAKIASRPRKNRVSELQQFDAIAKAKGGGHFVNIKDLNIKL